MDDKDKDLEKKENTDSPEKTEESDNKTEPPSTDDSKLTSFRFLDTEPKPPSPEETKTPDSENEMPVGLLKHDEPEKIDEPEKTDDLEKTEEPEEESVFVEEKPAPKKEISSDEVKEWLKDIRPDTTKDVEKGSSFNFKSFFLMLFVILLISAVIGGLFYYRAKVEQVSVAPEEETTQQPDEAEESENETTPTPPAIDPDFAELSVNVLNGSGIGGEAGRLRTTLNPIGFKNIDVGNASSANHTTTTVQMKESLPDSVYEKLKEILETSYVVEKSDTAITESSQYDIIITIGSSKP
jgi:hypothetical protein